MLKVAALIVIASICIASCAPVTALDDPDIVLMRTKVVSEEDAACVGPDGREYTPMFDGCWRMKLKVIYPLIGTTDQDYVFAGRFGAQRRFDAGDKYLEVFVLEKRTPTGFVTLDWNQAIDGLCISDGVAKSVSSASLEKINYWRAKYPCH